jgi:archaellum component FlaF (FlaF/FlaG flagellin family)
MRETIKELNHLIEEHFHVHDNEKQDITIVLSTRDLLELLQGVNVAQYDEASISYDGDIHFVSSCVVGDTTLFFVENIHNSEGLIKHDETDILILPIYLPQSIRNELLKGGYSKVITVTEVSTYEHITKLIERQ